MKLPQVFLLLWLSLPGFVGAEDTLCAKAQVQLSQNTTLERQAFIATMTLANGLPVPLTDIAIQVLFFDSQGNPITATSNPNETSSPFFYRLNDNASLPVSLDANGNVSISWLIIPTLKSGGISANGTLYKIGATLSYNTNGEPNAITVTPAPITVMPLPSLTLDYFLPTEVYGDNPLTPQVEPGIPFSFGLRVRNTGNGPANGLQLTSAQPSIQSTQGLAAKFFLLGDEVNGLAQTNTTFLVNFGNIPAGGTGLARWLMISSLTGQFQNFKASFTHSDSLGGQATSLLTSVQTHLILHDVLIDVPGADSIRDFLAFDTTKGLLVYGSNGLDTPVMDLSPAASLQVTREHVYTLNLPANSSYLYASLTDPEGGQMGLKSLLRTDGKLMNSNNIWLSSKFNKLTNKFDYFFNVFDDTNTTGLGYTLTYAPLVGQPTLNPIADQTLPVGLPFQLMIKASDPNGPIPVLSALNLPNGPQFMDQKNSTGLFTWTPNATQVGSYSITFNATANGLTATRSAVFTVTTKSGLQSWKDKYFKGLTDPNIVGNQANPAHDGLTNLVKYALSLDPTQPEANNGVVIGNDAVNGKHYLTLTYTHRTDDPHLSFAVLASPQANAPAIQWTAQTQTVPMDQSQVPSGMEMNKVRDSVAIEDGPLRRYLKLQVNLTEN